MIDMVYRKTWVEALDTYMKAKHGTFVDSRTKNIFDTFDREVSESYSIIGVASLVAPDTLAHTNPNYYPMKVCYVSAKIWAWGRVSEDVPMR